jgi:tRNA(adenine34) deaminase
MKKFSEYKELKHRLMYDTYMQIAIKEAEKGKLDGNLPVGAVLVLQGNYVSDCNTDYSEHNSTNHAIINVINKANMINKPLHDAVIYSTVEPCLLCAMAIHYHGIKEVVFGAYDDKSGFVSSKLLVDHTFLNITYKGGVQAEKCIELLPKAMHENLRAE